MKIFSVYFVNKKQKALLLHRKFIDEKQQNTLI